MLARVFADSLLRWYARRLAPASTRAQGGLFTVIQRCAGDLRLSPHLHVVALDGCFVAGSGDKPVFRPLPHLESDEVADVLRIAKTRILKALARLGAVEVMPDALAVDDAWAARDPVMAHLAAAAVASLPPAGFAERKRNPVTVVDLAQARSCPRCPSENEARRVGRAFQARARGATGEDIDTGTVYFIRCRCCLDSFRRGRTMASR